LVTFFAQALRRRSGANSEAGRGAAKGRMPGVKKVTRSPAGRVEALHFKRKKSQRRWIPAFAGMTSFEARADSGFRRNEPKKFGCLNRQEKSRPQATFFSDSRDSRKITPSA
jgi:hypothetical protein